MIQELECNVVAYLKLLSGRTVENDEKSARRGISGPRYEGSIFKINSRSPTYYTITFNFYDYGLIGCETM
jgi:hypothetical protein